jgi:hypothetical protein
MKKYYSGVGSRSTPDEIMTLMGDIAMKLSENGYILRSGAADGADSAFEKGVTNPSKKEVYIAWNGFSNRTDSEEGVYCLKGDIILQAEQIAKTLHPAWDVIRADGKPVLTKGAKALHTRNVFQVLGNDLNTPSNFLICWAETDSKNVPKGGTRTAWMLARNHNIPCFNLNIQKDLDRLQAWLNN